MQTFTNTTTPRGLGYEHGLMAAEIATVDGTVERLTDSEILAYFVTDDPATTVTEYRDGWRLGYHASESEDA